VAVVPDQVSEERADGENLRLGHLQGAAQALRQPHPGNDHRNRAAAMVRQCRRDRERSRPRLQKSEEDDVRWVYLDIGKFGGLAETMDESIRYPIRTSRTATPWRPASWPVRPATRRCAVRETALPLPVSLEIGDRVLIEGTGAYTATYSSVAFNGFPPLKTYHI